MTESRISLVAPAPQGPRLANRGTFLWSSHCHLIGHKTSSKAFARPAPRYDHFTLAIYSNVISPVRVQPKLTLQAPTTGAIKPCHARAPSLSEQEPITPSPTLTAVDGIRPRIGQYPRTLDQPIHGDSDHRCGDVARLDLTTDFGEKVLSAVRWLGSVNLVMD